MREILERLQRELPILEPVHHETNRGYGAAVRTGLAAGQAGCHGYALVMDSDLTNDPRCIHQFLGFMERAVDLIKASRYVPGGAMVGVPFHRVLISIVGNRLASLLLGVPIADCTNGFRPIRLALWERIGVGEPGFASIMEEMYWAAFLGASFAVVPYTLTAHSGGQSASHFRDKPRVFLDYLRCPLRTRLGSRPGGQLNSGRRGK